MREVDQEQCPRCGSAAIDTGRWLMCCKCGWTELKPGAKRLVGQVIELENDQSYLIREWELDRSDDGQA